MVVNVPPSLAPFDCVALETTPLTRPGADRGLGRYTTACLSAATEAARDVVAVHIRARRPARLTEFADVVERTARLARVDAKLFHATTPYGLAATRKPTVVSVLDVIPLDVAAHRRTGLKAKAFFGMAARADAVLTLSDFSADRIAAVLGYPRERIFVSPLEPAASFRQGVAAATATEQRRGNRFALCLVDLATPDPRKRHDWVPRLATRLGQAGVELVVVGAHTDRAFSAARNVRALGRVTDADLAALYRGCGAFCYFSAYEGQGLPPLEAMSAGAPVVAMANSAVTEVVGTAGMLIAEPGEPWEAQIAPAPWMDRAIAEMAEAAVTLCTDEAQRAPAAERAIERAATFTWNRFRDATVAAYRSVA